ncbi:MAG: hypothetical protein V1792_19790 [Pseudomonadota bacterium]
MKKLVGIALGILFLGVAAFLFTGSALAGPGHGGHGRHGGHGIHGGPGGHGGHYGHHGHYGPRGHYGHYGPRVYGFRGPAVYWGSTWNYTNCYWVRRCFPDAFGIVRCSRVQVCE